MILGLSFVLERSIVSPECIRMYLDSLRINNGFSDKSLHLIVKPLRGSSGPACCKTSHESEDSELRAAFRELER